MATLEEWELRFKRKLTGTVYQCFESETVPGEWVAGAVDHASEGEIYIALFSGPGAQQRAVEYAAWKNGALVRVGELLEQARLCLDRLGLSGPVR